ncbi:NADP-dependent oxidoreductase domain-containing protein [Parachaetomium inaequale]|uniref:NADP-dependent oxidoreductase domain-containing protein n=1 Tax=Parachaetomium inaequale TaxID=2588326 RepID=A0AAN6PAU6_9PEZI|nr:NADP-dependent oxidoreductase domain-containing protein [Parachaetomium inaequale]
MSTTPSIPTRQLGRDGPTIPILGLGLMGLSSFYGTPPPDEERFKLLDRAHELGCVHWDSAALYGDSEDLLGRWFERTGKRKDIFLATKFGNYVRPDGGREFRNDPEFIRGAVKEALRRLKTDYIDLMYCHRISGKTPIEDVIETLKEFVVTGQIRAIGLSECGADTLRRASAIHPISAYQIEYSPFSTDIERRPHGPNGSDCLLQTCRDLGIAVVAYCPLGRGMLTGRYKSADDFAEGDFRRLVPRFSGENFPRNMKLVEELKGVADSKKEGCTVGQLTLAWMMRQEGVFPIPGTKRIGFLEENWGANRVFGELTGEEEREIRAAVERAEVWGTRYPEGMMGGLVKDTPPRE